MKYLYFDAGNDAALSIPANRLLSMDHTEDTKIVLSFEDIDAVAGATTDVELTINTGKEKKVMQTITEAVHGGKDNFLIVADSVNNLFVDSDITAVSVQDSGTGSNGLTAGAGITSGTDTVYHSWIERNGNIIKTSIYIDLDGLQGPGTIGDIIGVNDSTDPAHIGQITTARNGVIFAGKVSCFETPAGGDPDINIYAADEGSGVEDSAIADLTETSLVNTGDHSTGSEDIFTSLPTANQYLYLTTGDVTAVEYTAGKLLIELYGAA